MFYLFSKLIKFEINSILIKLVFFIQKDAKKNKFGANKLPLLSYNGDNFDKIEINPNGERFTYVINNDGTLEDFYAALDDYISQVLSCEKRKTRRLN